MTSSQSNLDPNLISVHLDTVEFHNLKGNAFLFLPAENFTWHHALAIFAHGYTSHKGSILNWGIRVAEMGIPGILFDLPGHYLGSFTPVESFEEFKQGAHFLFLEAKKKLEEKLTHHFQSLGKNRQSDPFFILGGHSLGALLSLKALALPEFDHSPSLAIGVGFGMSPANEGINHIFETSFYQKTLHVRGQLVSPALSPQNVFPWIKKEKENLTIHGKTIHLITGEDDVVAPVKSAKTLMENLLAQGNQVTLHAPKKLSHHAPELAAAHIGAILRPLLKV